jgi:hypothetical protein
VNDLTVVCARAHARARLALENADAVASARNRKPGSQTHNAGAYHGDVYLDSFHGLWLFARKWYDVSFLRGHPFSV